MAEEPGGIWSIGSQRVGHDKLLSTHARMRVLVIVNSARMTTVVHVSFQTMVFFVYVPRSGISGSCSHSIFSFLRKLYTLFSIVAVPIYIPTNSIGGFPSLHTLSSIYCL